ncbi:MAG TPA: MFS transporter, partial [Actinomycetales bacterium]|nr:MFS transporter [Actinomycetales bacterium]
SVTTGGQAAVITRVPRERTGAAVATHFFMLDLGTGLGPILFGLLVPALGYAGVFWVAAVLTLLALPVYVADLRRHRAASG